MGSWSEAADVSLYETTHHFAAKRITIECSVKNDCAYVMIPFKMKRFLQTTHHRNTEGVNVYCT